MAEDSGPATDAETEKRAPPQQAMLPRAYAAGLLLHSRPGDSGATPKSPHVRFMLRLGKEGVVLFSGPVTDSTDIRWMAVFASGDHLTVRDYMEDDPDVISGRLKYEIHPWTFLGTGKIS